MKAIEIKNITKRFGNFVAVDSLSFSVERGEVFGLLGPNGAGKTTTIRMIMNIIYPDSGEIAIFGDKLSEATKSKIGYLPEERGLYKKMKVLECLTYFGILKGIGRRDARKKALEWLERFGMAENSQYKIEELSRGMQQKIQFISTILHNPDLIILDEPFAGLDPVNRKLIKDVMREMREGGKTIIFSTHQMHEVERLCESICLINRGKSVLLGNLKEIRRKYGKNSIIVEYSGDISFLHGFDGVLKVEDYGNYAEIYLEKNANPQKILKKLSEVCEISKFEVAEPTLDKIFIDVVQEDYSMEDFREVV